ncbi:hypothetical protein A0H81_08878 [Grifola frondosa]|uniref:DUF6533 domain-containing protein n=1 Tax=Grifola frondosa TaxID=5627 RepID=A0A1C7M4C5_GRIFR|nr:hypothetical protein A0H81_08878 [Grifola frondosa]
MRDIGISADDRTNLHLERSIHQMIIHLIMTASKYSMADTIAGIIAQEEALLRQALNDVFIVNICTAAATTWVAYDVLLTLGEEMEFLWKAKNSLAKMLYFLVRYYNLMTLILLLAVNTNSKVGFKVRPVYSLPPSGATTLFAYCDKHCQRWLWFEAIGAVYLSGILGEALLVLRLYAAYARSKKALAIILLLYLVESILGLVTAIFQVKGIHLAPRISLFPIPGCVGTANSHGQISLKFWITAMSITCIYFVLILSKFLRDVPLQDKPSSILKLKLVDIRQLSPLTSLFVRDAAFYFLVVLAANLLNLICFVIFANRVLESLGTPWLMAVFSITSSRLCLSLRGFVSNNVQGDGDHDIELQNLSTLPDVEFAAAGNATTGRMLTITSR